ncbi:putative glycerophosphodiester phosphodiesterase [Rosa chinensis]|uniref:glycerophosphodiester phosphodiesterase n=1 Tax=Rosa chinensis TaxID=74649 RepID=A0A2P6PKL2_ROSCH|nr:putative glycerophosphodiester phosphodiesterase [Rosa chinensis]
MLVLIRHRGNGTNMLQSSDIRMRGIKENSILSFNTAAQFPIDFVEFDVQVTKDDCPVIFHDNFIVSEDKDVFIGKRVTDLKLPEFLSYEPQKQLGEFDDHIVYKERQLKHVLQLILQLFKHVVNEYAEGRRIFFSTFQPDAALLIRKMQSSYPVYF